MPVPSPVSTRRTVAALSALTVVTGLVDAVSYLRLGRVFVANMTGNVVFLGFSLHPHSRAAGSRPGSTGDLRAGWCQRSEPTPWRTADSSLADGGGAKPGRRLGSVLSMLGRCGRGRVAPGVGQRRDRGGRHRRRRRRGNVRVRPVGPVDRVVHSRGIEASRLTGRCC
jgi:hypothetical protein